MAKKTTKSTKVSNPVKVKIEEAKTHKAKKAGFKISDKKYEVAMPENFNFDDYNALKKVNFVTEALYFEHRALEAEHRALKFREMATEAAKYGSKSEQAKVKRIKKLQDKMAELKAQLEEQGIDVNSIISENAK